MPVGLVANGQAGVEDVLDVVCSGIDSALPAGGRGAVFRQCSTQLVRIQIEAHRPEIAAVVAAWGSLHGRPSGRRSASSSQL